MAQGPSLVRELTFGKLCGVAKKKKKERNPNDAEIFDCNKDWGEANNSEKLCSVASVVSDSLRPIDCSLPASSVHGILQARVLEWVAMPSSRGSSQPRNRTHISGISCIVGSFFNH